MEQYCDILDTTTPIDTDVSKCVKNIPEDLLVRQFTSEDNYWTNKKFFKYLKDLPVSFVQIRHTCIFSHFA